MISKAALKYVIDCHFCFALSFVFKYYIRVMIMRLFIPTWTISTCMEMSDDNEQHKVQLCFINFKCSMHLMLKVI